MRSVRQQAPASTLPDNSRQDLMKSDRAFELVEQLNCGYSSIIYNNLLFENQGDLPSRFYLPPI
jgi:hypothetical protein